MKPSRVVATKHGWPRSLEDQKIAAFGSSYRCTRNRVGAAEGCDLLIYDGIIASDALISFQ
ncbi:hypothetical protein E3W21_09600 [Pseudomonas sp. F01002]|nr:hypothetical protein E3W21_09600 [Pseudomonas sp. F01002]